MRNKTIRTGLALMVAVTAFGQNAVPHSSGGIAGIVRYPDGTPSIEATVSAVTECTDVGYNRVQEVKTSTDGAFYVPAFLDVSCNQVRISASKVEDLWLKTGNDHVFYGKDNGTTTLVETSPGGSPTTTEITLGRRGALVSFRVRDVATDRFIWAGLYLERRSLPGAKFGSMDIATGRDGSPDTVLLPAGQYRISVERYSCKGVDYSTVRPPQEIFAVEPGQRLAKDISVDVRLIKPMKSDANPRRKPCKP